VLHPHLVVGHHAAVGVGAVGGDALVAAACGAAALALERILDQRVEIGLARGNYRQPDGAVDRD